RENVMRELALSYGVQAEYMEPRDSRDGFLSHTITHMVSQGRITLDDMVLVIGGSFGPSNGASFMEISKASALVVNK
ncbi:MAG TPA: pyruvate kinase, partial [Tenuifilaceae bacterium]|nr:pyruvate kinase [Tenuifilaceae bacterium]